MVDTKIMNVTYFPSEVNQIIFNYALSVVNDRNIKTLVGEFEAFDQNNFGWTNAIDQGQWKFFLGTSKIVLTRIIDPIHRGLQDKVVGLIRTICVEIQKWMDDHRYIERAGIDIEDSFHWFNEGMIDREETAKDLVINENLSIQSRFELACNYCFMHHVENLWNSMSESEKRRYSREYTQGSRIVDFWTKWVTTGASKDLVLSPNTDFDQLCFYAYYTNSVALSYFLELLTTEDREQYLTKIAREKYLIPRMVSFCLTEMNSYQKAEMLVKTPFKTLKCFLDFPWQASFLVTSFYMWSYLRETDFVHLIYFIIYERIIPEWNDCNYMELLTEFWLQSPYDFKTYVTDKKIFEVLYFIVDRMITEGFVKTPDLNNFFKGFILPKDVEKSYQKACLSC